MKLVNLTSKVDLATDVMVASSFWQRSKGLLGESEIGANQTLWIQGSRYLGCSSIHTFFMRFAIDVIFVDRKLKVIKVYRGLGPWRMTWPAPKAYSVFELASGRLENVMIQIGDQLHVGD